MHSIRKSTIFDVPNLRFDNIFLNPQNEISGGK